MQDGKRLRKKRALQVSVCSIRRVLLSKRDASHQKRGDHRQARPRKEKEPTATSLDRQSKRFSELDRLVDDAPQASLLVQLGQPKTLSVSELTDEQRSRSDERWSQPANDAELVAAALSEQ